MWAASTDHTEQGSPSPKFLRPQLAKIWLTPDEGLPRTDGRIRSMLDYDSWKADVAGLTLEELRCDVPPIPHLVKVFDKYGLDRCEVFTLRLEAEMGV